MTFKLHPQLQADCFPLGTVDNSMLLLHKNALLPWFILVPDTSENELFKLDINHQQSILKETSQIANFVSSYFKSDKLNIATIGNIVPQLHIHIIGRHTHDFCWPAPVWGQNDSAEYDSQKLLTIKQSMLEKKLIK